MTIGSKEIGVERYGFDSRRTFVRLKMYGFGREEGRSSEGQLEAE